MKITHSKWMLLSLFVASFVDSLTKQSQISRSNVSHLVVDVLLQDCG